MSDINEAIRRELFDQFQMVLSGRPAVEGLAAATDLTGALTAFLCDTPEQAETVLRSLTDDMIRDVRANWAESREQRAGAYVAFNGYRRPSV